MPYLFGSLFSIVQYCNQAIHHLFIRELLRFASPQTIYLLANGYQEMVDVQAVVILVVVGESFCEKQAERYFEE